MCPHCFAKKEISSDTIEDRFTCQSCGEIFDPFPEAATISISSGAQVTLALKSLYEAYAGGGSPPTADWKPEGGIKQQCPQCRAVLEETVEFYRLNRCSKCLAVFRPVLETLGVRADHTLERFGRFAVLGTLGHGGMGIVYKAHHPERDCPVALKVILNDDDWSGISRFYREGETVARLKHPHIVKIYEIGQYDGIPYQALEYLAGGSLLDRMKRRKLGVQEAMDLSIPLARTLHYAHERGVIHRDLKPANVLLTADGVPKIGDFGLVKRFLSDTDLGRATISIPSWYGFLRKIASRTHFRAASTLAPHPNLLSDVGEVLGTPAYMAPEQAVGDSGQVGAAADIFSFGVMLYQMLTGRVPFEGRNIWDGVRNVPLPAPLPPSARNIQVPIPLDEIVLKCINSVPADRFESAAELAEALEHLSPV